MKKFIMKLFPSFFGVTIREYVDFEKINDPTKPLRLLVLNEETRVTSDMLGITEERASYLEKQVQKALIDSTGYIGTIQALEKDIKHINEFYMCVLVMQAADSPKLSGMGGLMAAILGGIRGPEDPEGE